MKRVRIDLDGTATEGRLEGDVVVAGNRRIALADARLLPPCVPTKICCVGRNYRAHAAEMDAELPLEPLLFFKPPSAIAAPGGAIVYPRQSSRVDYEGELAVVIGRRCKDVSADRAHEVIAGYTAFNDVTARDLQKSDGQWARAKGFDSFAPIGPCIVDDIDPSALRLRTYLNGELKQDGATADLLFSIPTLVEYISAAFTLEAGDVIATGTPSGIGPMRPGDEVRVEIDGIGALTNRVVAPLA